MFASTRQIYSENADNVVQRKQTPSVKQTRKAFGDKPVNGTTSLNPKMKQKNTLEMKISPRLQHVVSPKITSRQQLQQETRNSKQFATFLDIDPKYQIDIEDHFTSSQDPGIQSKFHIPNYGEDFVLKVLKDYTAFELTPPPSPVPEGEEHSESEVSTFLYNFEEPTLIEDCEPTLPPLPTWV